MYRGEVWLVNLDPTVGTEISDRILAREMRSLFLAHAEAQRCKDAECQQKGRSQKLFCDKTGNTACKSGK
ncbi:transcriptional modulator of MazE/toxin MazF [Calothrix brevissima NIES-22]|nr:transcriptional modulator of MazE/toxin MazF [Calothrix brevissima NIES-22]